MLLYSNYLCHLYFICFCYTFGDMSISWCYLLEFEVRLSFWFDLKYIGNIRSNRRTEQRFQSEQRVGGREKTLLWVNRSPKRTDWERTVYSRKRSTCAWWACDNMNGTFVESSKCIMLSYSGLCQRRRIHCNRTTSYCSLFFLVLWTSIYHYLVQKLIQMLHVVWRKNREMIVARMS